MFGIVNVGVAATLIKELSHREKVDRSQVSTADVEKPTAAELRSMIIAIFLYFVVIAVFSIFETMITVVTDADFGWTPKDNGYLFIAVGILSVIVFASISTPYFKRVDDRLMMIIGTVFHILGLLVGSTWRYPHLQDKLTHEQFYVASALIGIGYPIASAYMFSIYSKVLNPVFQGTKMGYLTAGGSLARMVGPVWATNAFKYGGGELLFAGTDLLVVVSLVVLLINYRILGPHPAYFLANAQGPNSVATVPNKAPSPAPHMSVNADDGKK